MQRIRFMPEGEADHTLSGLLSSRLFRLSLPFLFLLLYLTLPLYLWGLGINGAQAETHVGGPIQFFTANLSSPGEAMPNTNKSIGTGRAVMTVMSDTLHYRIFVADVMSITAAHIHDGLPGTNGPVVHDLYTGTGTFDPAHPISGTIILSTEEKAKLQAGDYYINVRTTLYTGGQIRGPLEEASFPTSYNALFLGRNEVNPSVETPASGVGTFTLIPTDTYTLTYQLHVADIMSITAAHIYLGAVGQNGDIAHGIYTGTGTFDPDTPLNGSVNLSAKDLLDLVSGYLYLNIHTETHPNGEIRGQMVGPRP